ncbi:MAG: hypothetical protein RI981_1526 [Bacteroidota bacterium]|jgi:uncharacterized protein (TIGR02145 family)
MFRLKFILGTFVFAYLISGCKVEDPIADSPCDIGTFTYTTDPKFPKQISLKWGEFNTNSFNKECTVSFSGTFVGRKGPNETDFTNLENVKYPTESYVDTTVKPNTTYEYRIYRWNGDANGNPKYLTVVTPSLPLPSSPGAVVLEYTSPTTATVSWLNNAAGTAEIPVVGTKVYRKSEAETSFTLLATLGATDNVYYDKGLTPDTKYTYQVVRFNNYGDGPTSSVTARTDKFAVYEEVTISGKTWMLKNLDVSTYRNGDVIPEIKNLADWNKATAGAWCYYNFGSAMNPNWGKLYNKYAVDDPRGLAPQGWHIPSKTEWMELITAAGVPGAPKIKATTGWRTPFVASNSTGFTAYPAGGIIRGQFDFNNVNLESYFWIKDPGNGDLRYYIYMQAENNDINIYPDALEGGLHGFSVRCRKDL